MGRLPQNVIWSDPTPLREYLDRFGGLASLPDVLEEEGASLSPSNLCDIANGRRRPGPKIRAALHRATRGSVPENGWFRRVQAQTKERDRRAESGP